MASKSDDWKRFGCFFPLFFSLGKEDLGNRGKLSTVFELYLSACLFSFLSLFVLTFMPHMLIYGLSQIHIFTRSSTLLCFMMLLIII